MYHLFTMKNIILLSILMSVVLSCTKTEAPPTVSYGAVYAKSGIAGNGPFRLFAKSGEIKDQNLVNFHKDLDSLVFVSLAQTLAYANSFFLDTLRFDDALNATAKLTVSPVTYRVEQTGSLYLLTSTDTLTGYIAPRSISQSIHNFLPKERMIVYSEGFQSSFQGINTYYHRFTDRFIVAGPKDGGDLTVPVIFYVDRYANGEVTTNYIHGRLDPDFYKSLGAGDTLACMNFDLLYRK